MRNLSNYEIVKIAEGMPGGLQGFCKTWGWVQFGRALLAAAAATTPDQARHDALEEAAAAQAAIYEGDDRQDIRADVFNAFAAGAEWEANRRQTETPFAWAEFDGEGSYELVLYEDNEGYRDEFLKRNPNPIYKTWVFPLVKQK